MILQTRYLYVLKLILPVTDVLMLNLVYRISVLFSVYFGLYPKNDLLERDMIVCNLIWLFAALFFRLYSDYGAGRLEHIYRCTWRTILLHGLCFCFYLWLEQSLNTAHAFVLIFYGFLAACFIVNRFVGTAIQFLLISKFNVSKKVAVMGSNATGERLAEFLLEQRNVDFYGFIADHSNEALELAVAAGVEDVYVSVPPDRMSRMHILVQEADKHCLRLKFVPDIAGVLTAPHAISYMGGQFPIITLREEPMELMVNRFKKRIFDLVFSTFVIVFILSWLFPLIALLIRMESKGPVFFRQLRSGRNDEPFWCLKFRSMRLNAESAARQATKHDERITKVGRFLRKSSLDELPQFFNVFMGSMTIVGPRPHMLSHTELYRGLINQFMVRHFMKPGITGWAQVNGCRGGTEAPGAMERRVKYDIWYLENWTSMLDVKIVFMTVINMLKGESNAY